MSVCNCRRTDVISLCFVFIVVAAAREEGSSHSSVQSPSESVGSRPGRILAQGRRNRPEEGRTEEEETVLLLLRAPLAADPTDEPRSGSAAVAARNSKVKNEATAVLLGRGGFRRLLPT